MREIGGEFWDIPLSDKENYLFPADTEWFMSGRDALSAIVATINIEKKISTVGVPSWCCDSMIIPFVKEGIDVVFYPVTMGETFFQNVKPALNCDAILVMDYFGYDSIPSIENYEGIIIRDMTHSILIDNRQEERKADYYFGSIRKWGGVATGGFAYGGNLKYNSNQVNSEYTKMRRRAMKEKEKYIHYETDDKSYLEVFEKAESVLDGNNNIHGSTDSDIAIAKHIAIDEIREKRRRNAKILIESMNDSLIRIFPRITEKDCPLFVPVLSEKRDKLKKHLIENEIFCPVHWPITDYHKLDRETKVIYENELSIVCDQRYNEEDMEKICECISMVFV